MSLEPARWGGRPVWAEIDLDALASNLRILADRAAPARLYAVVKANAYGHGAVACGRAALEASAAGLAVICLDEAEELRRAGIEAPVLVLGWTPPSDAALASASAPAAPLDRQRLEEELGRLRRREAELRRALALADHPALCMKTGR